MPEGITTSDIAAPSKGGEYLFPIFWTNKYRHLKPPKHSYLGFFSGLQIESDSYLREKFDEYLIGKDAPTCPFPPQNKALGELGSPPCTVRYEHTLKNGNIIRYIDAVGWLRTDDYDFHERYFEYFALYSPSGQVLKRVTPIWLKKSRGLPDICGDFIQDYMINAVFPGVGKSIWLDDDSFITLIGPFLVRINQNLETRWQGMKKNGLYLVDTSQLERLGHVRKNPKKSCLQNEMDTDAAIVNYLQQLN